MYKFFEGIEEHIFFLPIEIETEVSCRPPFDTDKPFLLVFVRMSACVL